MLTKKQQRLLDYIKFYQAESDGVTPSFEEMKEAMGLKSKSGVHRLVTGLERRGFVYRLPNHARAIEVVERQPRKSSLAGYTYQELVNELTARISSPSQPSDVSKA